MNRFVQLTALAISIGVYASQVFAQSGYTPGQVFGTQRSTPRPTSTPASYYRPPVYTPVATPRPRITSTPAKSISDKGSSLYNLKKSGSSDSNPVSKPKSTPETDVKPAVVEKTAVAKSVDIPESTTAAASAAQIVDSIDKTVISRRRTGQKFVALTYDDGPNPSYTPKLMEYLKENQIPATFFLCGNMVKNHPEIVKQLAENGFELANHSYDHPQLTKLSRDGVVKQLQDTHDLIKEASGVDVKLMRPPFGAQNEMVRNVCESMGYKVILWDVDTLDWKKRPVGLMVSTIMKETGDGSIILMHDRLHGGNDTVIEATRQAVDLLKARGYKFVTVGEMLSYDSGSGSMVRPAVIPQTTTTGTLVVETPGLPIPLVPVSTNIPTTSSVIP